MASKSELIGQLEAVLARGDIEEHRVAVDSLKASYEDLVAQEKAAAQAKAAEEARQREADAAKAATEQPGPPPAPTPLTPAAEHTPIESAQLDSEEDKRFKQLLDSFHTKVNDLHRARIRAEQENLATKKALLEQLRELIAKEENIGTAFQGFNEIGEQWKAVGPIPNQDYRDLQQDYNQLREDFFYHIGIYKELRDHDLRKNAALKRALAADMAAVQRVDSVREAEALVKEYQEKWHEVGPVPREEREEVGDAFWSATRAVYDRINEYYKARRAEHEANLASKEALVAKVRELVKQVDETPDVDWKEFTDKVLELQQAWKAIGFATKKENERVWQDFRDACNVFFERRNAHYNEVRTAFAKARERKLALIEQAELLANSTDWRPTADKLKALQAQWKEAGHAGRRDENKLWQRFRKACDRFFKARTAAFKEQHAQLAAHVEAKQALIAEIKAFTLSGDREADFASLKEFGNRWVNSGHVPPREYDKLSGQYRAALDEQYAQLKVNDTERKKLVFQSRVQGLAAASDGKERLERERRFVERKIRDLELEVRQREANMSKFSFTSAAGEAMRKTMEQDIDQVRREIARLEMEREQLSAQLRAPKAEQAEEQATEHPSEKKAEGGS